MYRKSARCNMLHIGVTVDVIFQSILQFLPLNNKWANLISHSSYTFLIIKSKPSLKRKT
uniref:Uncharacterized protein n=1 Tax=Arundo donax TaxID=35708 RepID=A0A0A8Y6M5_ARUDO